MVVLKGTLVFCFGPNLKLRFWPRPKLNNKAFSAQLGHTEHGPTRVQAHNLYQPLAGHACCSISWREHGSGRAYTVGGGSDGFACQGRALRDMVCVTVKRFA